MVTVFGGQYWLLLGVACLVRARFDELGRPRSGGLRLRLTLRLQIGLVSFHWRGARGVRGRPLDARET